MVAEYIARIKCCFGTKYKLNFVNYPEILDGGIRTNVDRSLNFNIFIRILISDFGDLISSYIRAWFIISVTRGVTT
jgi:hypothetical protein